jgi:Xaa-Pro aminopeptidase
MTDIFARRRASIIEKLGPHAALVLAAAPELLVGRDTELRYVADAELFYLTGYTEPEAVLVLGPASSDAPFTMFVRPRDPARELWTGKRGGEDAARALFSADAAHPVSELSSKLPVLLASVDVIYARLGAGRPEVDGVLMQLLADARRTRPRTGISAHSVTDPGELIDAMRVVKDADELATIGEAARVSCDAFSDALGRIRPGVGEWEIEAALEYGFRVRGGDGPAFPTIAASGINATVLHYIENRAIARDGDLLLLDAGARYRMYCADITRTVPVSGTFSAEQRVAYDVVLAAHDAAVRAACPGASFDAPHMAAQRVLADGLIQLGLVQGSIESVLEADYGVRRFFPHRTSHWLGLDVHDVGAYATRAGAVTLVPGMVMTIEPGLYIAELGVGIRIEDDIVITNEGCEVLTAAVPTDAAQIEALMRGAGS